MPKGEPELGLRTPCAQAAWQEGPVGRAEGSGAGGGGQERHPSPKDMNARRLFLEWAENPEDVSLHGEWAAQAGGRRAQPGSHGQPCLSPVWTLFCSHILALLGLECALSSAESVITAR